MKNEAGLGTIEIVILVAILVSLALLFKDSANGVIKRVLDQLNDIDIDIEQTKGVIEFWCFKQFV